ncbi:MAG: DUF3570 domain-containing protein [Ignavibacteria bacterium]|nr:DUF3570 domain-containing protein [Ignavibacteria bacterium]
MLLPMMLFWSTMPAIAGGDQMGFTTYFFSDSGENSVITSSFNLAKKLLQQTVFLIDIELDNVTVPPVTAVTGATRPQRRKSEPFEKSRGQVIVGIEQGIGPNTTIAGNFYRSQEVDYTSSAVVGTFSQDLFQKNTTITLRGQYSADRVGKITEVGDILNKKKKVYTGALNISQLLSPTTVLDMSYDFVYLKGFLSDPYRLVKVHDLNGAVTTTDEMHPRKRTRHAGTGKISQLIPTIKASLIGSYRYYFDTWRVRSHTAEVKLNKYIVKDLILGINYRYYTQTAAKFYQDKYVGQEFLNHGLRTADYKLQKFSSNNFGFSLTYLLRGLGKAYPDLEFLQNSSIEVMYFRYFNDLDFTADIIQMGIKFSI